MSTCRELSEQYAKETGINTPASNAPIYPDRSDWLLTQTWSCQFEESKGVYKESSDKKVYDNIAVTVPATGDQPSDTTVLGVPMTILQEDGFLDWVNQRGMGCINKVTGIVNTHPYGDGVPYTEPDIDTPYPVSRCSSACYNVSADQETCFECVKNALEQNELTKLCPALYNGDTIKTVDTSVMKKSLGCHTCIATNSHGLTVATSHIDENGHLAFETTYDPTGFDRIWGCVTGNVSTPLSEGAIVGIIIGCMVAVALLVVGLVILIRSEQAKKKAKTSSDVKKIASKPASTPSVSSF